MRGPTAPPVPSRDVRRGPGDPAFAGVEESSGGLQLPLQCRKKIPRDVTSLAQLTLDASGVAHLPCAHERRPHANPGALANVRFARGAAAGGVPNVQAARGAEYAEDRASDLECVSGPQ